MKECRAHRDRVDGGDDAERVNGAEQRHTVERHPGVAPAGASRPQLSREVVARGDARQALEGPEQIGLAQRDRLREVRGRQRTRVAREKPIATIFLGHQPSALRRVRVRAEGGYRRR